jgi:hypothetical protein
LTVHCGLMRSSGALGIYARNAHRIWSRLHTGFFVS